MIDEKKLIKAMYDKYNRDYNVALKFEKEETIMAGRVLKDIQNIIDRLPKTGGWIPVETYLPAPYDDVDVLMVGKANVLKGGTWSIHNLPNKTEVLAWRPVGDPQEGEK